MFSFFRFFQQKPQNKLELTDAEQASVNQYLAQNKHFEPKSIAEQTFVVFDTETTGLDIKKDQLVSIGAIKVKNRQMLIAESFETYVKSQAIEALPVNEHTDKDIPIHEILKAERLQEGRPIKEVLIAFLNYIGDAVLVAHHAAFDLGLLNHLYKTHFGIDLQNKWVDTAHLAIRLEKSKAGQNSHVQPHYYELDYWIRYFNIEAQDRHTAAGDSFITGELLLNLLHLAHKRGLTHTKDLIHKRFF